MAKSKISMRSIARKAAARLPRSADLAAPRTNVGSGGDMVIAGPRGPVLAVTAQIARMPALLDGLAVSLGQLSELVTDVEAFLNRLDPSHMATPAPTPPPPPTPGPGSHLERFQILLARQRDGVDRLSALVERAGAIG